MDAEERLDRLFELYADTLYRVCFAYLGNAHDSEDAVQDVFLKLVENMPAFAGDKEEKAFIIVTACNHCKSLLRKRKRRHTVELDAAAEQPSAGSESSAELHELLASLPGKCRDIVILHCLEGYSLAEIAKASGVNESTVRSRFYYARKYLSGALGDFE